MSIRRLRAARGNVIAALFIAVGHSVALQVSERLGEADLAIQRGQWTLAAGSIAAFLIFLALCPSVRVGIGDRMVSTRPS